MTKKYVCCTPCLSKHTLYDRVFCCTSLKWCRGRRYGGVTKNYNDQSFFGGKNLANTEYTHKKHFSLTLTINRGKNSKDPKIEPKKRLTFFLSKFSSVMYNWNQNIVPILKINVTLPLLTFSCYFMKSMCIKMKKFGIFYQNISWKLSVCLSYNVIISKQREGLSFIKSF